MNFHRIVLFLAILGCLGNIILLVDYLLPQIETTEFIIYKGAEKHKHLNTGSRPDYSGHNVCKVWTESSTFYADKYFCYTVNEHDVVRLWKSPVLKNVTGYALAGPAGSKQNYSFTEFCFLYFPLFNIVAVLAALVWQNYGLTAFLFITLAGSWINFISWVW